MATEEEFQEADVLWPWPGASSTSDSPALPELYDGRDSTGVGFSCEPFSEPAAALASGSSASTSSALMLVDWSSEEEDGFFLSRRSTVVSGRAAASEEEELLEKDVLWPDDDDDDAAEFWCRSFRRVEEEAADAAACGKREGWRPRPLVSSPIDIPVATRTAGAARRRPAWP